MLKNLDKDVVYRVYDASKLG